MNFDNQQTNQESSMNNGGDNNYMLNDDKYQMLFEAQKTIRDKTDVMPKLKILVNKMITQDLVNKITEELIEQYS